jgi:hypothetical protein
MYSTINTINTVGSSLIILVSGIQAGLPIYWCYKRKLKLSPTIIGLQALYVVFAASYITLAIIALSRKEIFLNVLSLCLLGLLLCINIIRGVGITTLIKYCITNSLKILEWYNSQNPPWFHMLLISTIVSQILSFMTVHLIFILLKSHSSLIWWLCFITSWIWIAGSILLVIVQIGEYKSFPNSLLYLAVAFAAWMSTMYFSPENSPYETFVYVLLNVSSSL